ncbi:hypothetical protein [Kordiimonas sp.]|uniref:hypothetical protein n=1 Tax=Kordiimonas sp. TaxID=1970157 RepID=UPI003A9510E8
MSELEGLHAAIGVLCAVLVFLPLASVLVITRLLALNATLGERVAELADKLELAEAELAGLRRLSRERFESSKTKGEQ